MADVVAVALISTLGTGAVALATGLIAVWREHIRQDLEHRRFREQLEADGARMRAETVRATREQAVDRLRSWIARHIAIALDVDFLRLYPDDVGLAQIIDDRIKTMTGPSEEVSLSAVLSQFSDATILEKVRAIDEVRNKIGQHLNGPVRDMAGRAPLNNVQLAQLKELFDQATKQAEEMETMIADLNSSLEQYLIGADLAPPAN